MSETKANSLIFAKPKTEGDFLLFSDTTLNNLELSDCDMTVNGICTSPANINDCFKQCQPPNCNMGYFIETSDKTICAPLQMQNNDERPYYRIRNKDIYPELANTKSTVFVNQKTHPFPPNRANSVFCLDIFEVKEIQTGKSISVAEGQDVREEIKFGDTPVYLQIIPAVAGKTFIENYLAIRNGDRISINIPGTSYLLNYYENTTEWYLAASFNQPDTTIFQIFVDDPARKIGAPISYADTFYLAFNNSILIMNDLFRLQVDANIDIIRAKEHNKKCLFKLLPKIKGYYCENNTCNDIILDQADMDGPHVTHKGNLVTRNPTCWNICEKKHNKHYVFVIIVIIVILIVLLILFRH
jgi:hypothetical protein